MRKLILITGTALAVSASQAVAGGGRGGAMGEAGHHVGQNSFGGAAGCLCQAVHGVLGSAGNGERGRGVALGVGPLVNSISGLGAVRNGNGHGNGEGHGIGLAGVVSVTARVSSSVAGLGHGNAGLAGSVSAAVLSRN